MAGQKGTEVAVLEVKTQPKDDGSYVPSGVSERGYRYGGYWKKDERNVKTRVYVHPEEWGVMENLMNRRSRPYELYRRALPAMFEQLGIDPVKASWSQKAGCSCGCSPGFVLDARLGYDVWVTIKVTGADPLVADTPEAIATAADRARQVLNDPTLAPFIRFEKDGE